MKRRKKRRSTESLGTRLSLILLVACITGLIALWLIPEGGRQDGAPPPPPSKEPAGKTPRAAPDRHGTVPSGEKGTAGKRVAIVIDDIGHDPDALGKLLAIKAPLAFSVLPHAPHARSCADAIHRAGREVLLHLPMEPHGWPERDPGRGALFASMTASEIRRTLLEDLQAVPHAKGVNNHMGSKFMEDREALRVVFGVLRDRGLYFVDSRTTEASVARELAAEQALRFAERDLFLDEAEDPSRAAMRLERLLDSRDARSELLLIGHPYPETVSALEEAVPRLSAAGIRFVPLSELVEGREAPRGAAMHRNPNRNR
ncbi:MAG: divergent polysaccharide deacetylase family protein [Syntrophaceae bacterium]|nr:divergent polysaccharide deacetylase family protein [Syntrophaceae bacterium]